MIGAFCDGLSLVAMAAAGLCVWWLARDDDLTEEPL